MARLLYRLGASAARRPLAVVLLWMLLLGSAGGAMAAFQKPLSTEFELPGSDFGRVLDDLGEQIPAVAGGTGTVVLHADQPFTAAQQRAIDETLASWRALPHVTDVVDPFASQRELDAAGADLDAAEAELDRGAAQYRAGRQRLAQLRAAVESGAPGLEQELARGEVELAAARERLDQGRRTTATARELTALGDGVRLVSEDGTTALAQLRFDASAQEISPEEMARIPETGERLAEAGVEVDYGQEIVMESEIGGVGEILGLAVAGIVLLVMLGTLVMAGLPLTIAFVGVGVSLLGGLAATGLVELQQLAPVLGAMLGLAVGIDYALFIVNRHRLQLRDLVATGEEITREQVRHSIGLATGTAGTAVVVAGATVVISLAALSVSGIPILVQMGLLAAFTVTVTVLVALTLTPALLGLIGTRALARRHRTARATPRGPGWPERWVGLITRRAPVVLVLGIAILGLLALPASQLRLGLPDGGSEPASSTAHQAYVQVEEAFGVGANGPILVVATYADGVAQERVMDRQLQVGRELGRVEGVRDVLPIGVSEDRRTLAFQVVSEGGPSSAETVALTDELRGDLTDDLAVEGVEIGVTGQTVANIEVSEHLAGALPLYLALVVGLSLLLLMLVFRSVLVPLLATAGFLLSVGASFGAIVAVYQWGWLGEVFDVSRPGAVMSFMPTLLIGILFGLAMDYQMFLVSGMRESYVHGEEARAAVRSGFSSGARVVLAAALIMISVFSGFIFSGMTMARPIGFGLAVGVLADAFIVRMTLMPAAMSLLGDKVWWLPAWLDRLLPHVDVEGSSLVDASRPALGGAAARPGRELDEVSA